MCFQQVFAQVGEDQKVGNKGNGNKDHAMDVKHMQGENCQLYNNAELTMRMIAKTSEVLLTSFGIKLRACMSLTLIKVLLLGASCPAYSITRRYQQ